MAIQELSETLQQRDICDVQLAEPFMKHFKFLALCFIAGMAASMHTAAGQGINAVQNTPWRPVVARSAPAPKAFEVVNTAITPHHKRASHHRAARNELATELFACRAAVESYIRGDQRPADRANSRAGTDHAKSSDTSNRIAHVGCNA